MKFVRVMKAEDLPIGKSVIVSAGEEEVAIFNYKGKYYAINNTCPHKGAPLGEGRIEEGVCICPNHEWRFNLVTGFCEQNPYMKTRVYPIREKNEHLYIGFESAKEGEKKILGKTASNLPSSIKFKVPTIQKPINPDEEL